MESYEVEWCFLNLNLHINHLGILLHEDSNPSGLVPAPSLQPYLTLRDPMDCSPPGSSVHGILQARRLEWVAMPFSRGSSQPRNQSHISGVSCIGRWVL